MDDSWRQIIEQIHGSGRCVVLAITGGGSAAIAELLSVPGGSRTLLEAVVPYDHQALVDFLAIDPQHACSGDTAIAMARRARQRASRLARDDSAIVGLGATASLVSDRPKQGDHRCHIATATEDAIELSSIVLEKGLRDRAEEEETVAGAVVLALARACGVAAPSVSTTLGPSDCLSEQSMPLMDNILQLLVGTKKRVTVLPDGQHVTEAPVPRGVVAGSFNPLHAGHLGLARVASEILQAPVAFELSVINVDKPPLSAESVHRRVRQFAWRASVELTRAPTFLEKSRVLPGTTFVVGADTAERIVAPKYYGDSEPNMVAALDEIARHNCRFLVAGRIDAGGRFQTLCDIVVPPQFGDLFKSIPASHFRSDLSSTALRRIAHVSIDDGTNQTAQPAP